ncbi:hypothetical protein HK104_008116 [Borealophlyctis nickersoniae]|nr:hypothetical protein HK104_008116 [Borealophlyctis nickersoniae]
MYALTRVLGLGIIGCEGFLTNARGSIYERMSPQKQIELKDRITAGNLRFPSTVYDGEFEEYLGVQLGVDFRYEDFYNEHIRQAGETEATPTQNEPMETEVRERMETEEVPERMETEELPERMETEELPERRFCSICQDNIEMAGEELILPCLHETVDEEAQMVLVEDLRDHHVQTHFGDDVVVAHPPANEAT